MFGKISQLSFLFVMIQYFGQTLVKPLNEGWTFQQARLSNVYPAKVPGVVHTDLLENKLIEYPFFRLNERGVQWIDKEDWIYENTFDISPELSQKKYY